MREEQKVTDIETLKRELAEYLGLDSEDIDLDDDLSEDLHMMPSDLTDFIEILKSKNINTSGLNISKILTFKDLVEQLELDY